MSKKLENVLNVAQSAKETFEKMPSFAKDNCTQAIKYSIKEGITTVAKNSGKIDVDGYKTTIYSNLGRDMGITSEEFQQLVAGWIIDGSDDLMLRLIREALNHQQARKNIEYIVDFFKN